MFGFYISLLLANPIGGSLYAGNPSYIFNQKFCFLHVTLQKIILLSPQDDSGPNIEIRIKGAIEYFPYSNLSTQAIADQPITETRVWPGPNSEIILPEQDGFEWWIQKSITKIKLPIDARKSARFWVQFWELDSTSADDYGYAASPPFDLYCGGEEETHQIRVSDDAGGEYEVSFTFEPFPIPQP